LPAAAQTQSEHVRSRSATLMQQCCTHEKQKKYDRQNDKADACDMNTLKLSGCLQHFNALAVYYLLHLNARICFKYAETRLVIDNSPAQSYNRLSNSQRVYATGSMELIVDLKKTRS